MSFFFPLYIAVITKGPSLSLLPTSPLLSLYPNICMDISVKLKRRKVEFEEEWLCGLHSMTWTSTEEIPLEGRVGGWNPLQARHVNNSKP